MQASIPTTAPTSVLSGIRSIPTRRRGSNPNTRIRTLQGGRGPRVGQLNALGCPQPNLETETEETSNQRKGRLTIPVLSQFDEDDLPENEITDTMVSIFSQSELQKNFMITSDITIGEGSELGPNSSKLGVVEENKTCSTCHKGNLECPGHLAYIKLNAKIYHPLFFRLIISVLEVVCNQCAKPYLSRELLQEEKILNYSLDERLKRIAAQQKTSKVCRTPQEANASPCNQTPIFSLKDSKNANAIKYRLKGKERIHTYKIDSVYDILAGISDEDAQLLGFENGSRPEDMILSAFPVIPPCARPPIYRDGVIYDDDLTAIYVDIIRHNNAIPAASSSEDRDARVGKLEFRIRHFIDNSDGKYSQQKGKELMGIKQKITKKKGHIRGAMLGKRVNFSARTPITPDPSLKFNQIRIPDIWAPYLTQRVVLQHYNIKYWTELVAKCLAKNLPIPISYVSPGSGPLKGRTVKVSTDYLNKRPLQTGDTIQRWLKDGDYIIANRNPTLHRQGIMAFEVVLGRSKTVGLHLSVTTPYNADFDGDEVNIHAPQGYLALSELQMVNNVEQCIMNAQSNRPSVGIVYDGLTSAYLLTRSADVEVERDLFYDALLSMSNQDQIPTLNERLDRFGIGRFSGRALFSALLPEDLYYNRAGVQILNGVLVHGTITKNHIGVSSGSLIQVLFKDYGSARVVDFLTDASYVLGRYITETGFTVGMADCYPSNPEYRTEINREITGIRLQIEAMGTSVGDVIDEQRRERLIIGAVQSAKNIGGTIGNKYIGPDNRFRIMSSSGAKGSDTNTTQITGIIGQQFIKGGRIPYTITGNKRCLPYFAEGDLNPESQGFCATSFLEGLSPADMVFHQSASRESVMESSVKTPVSGTIQGVVTKALESFTVAYDGSVRDSANILYQYAYGNDGFSPEYLEKVSFGKEEYPSFINLDRIFGKINAKYGYFETAVDTTEVLFEKDLGEFEIIDEEEHEES